MIPGLDDNILICLVEVMVARREISSALHIQEKEAQDLCMSKIAILLHLCDFQILVLRNDRNSRRDTISVLVVGRIFKMLIVKKATSMNKEFPVLLAGQCFSLNSKMELS